MVSGRCKEGERGEWGWGGGGYSLKSNQSVLEPYSIKWDILYAVTHKKIYKKLENDCEIGKCESDRQCRRAMQSRITNKIIKFMQA